MLKVGQKAPDFKGITEKGKEVSLSDFKGKKLILFFYPKDNTETCTKEVCNLRDGYSRLKKEGFSLLGVSADSARKHANFIAKHRLPFSLIADTDRKIIGNFGVWGEKTFMGRTFDGIFRTTFIIDENGRIAHVIQKVESGRHAEQILDLISNQSS